MTKLIIKGAVYFDRENEKVLIPHFTGEFHTVDCTEYITEEELKESYGEDFIEENKGNYIEVEGKRYFYTTGSC